MENLKETYEIKSQDRELHVIGLIMEAMERHLSPHPEHLTESDLEAFAESKIRCLRYVADRLEAANAKT